MSRFAFRNNARFLVLKAIRILIPSILFLIQTISAQTITIYGRILTEKGNLPLEYATVAIYSSNDSLIGGALSKQNGDFTIENVQKKELILKVNYIGYLPGIYKLNLINSGPSKDLGNIKLSLNGELLKEIEIQAEKSQLLLSIDKRVYNVDKDLSALGGSAIDAMKNIPGITINSDNSVNLRNQTPTVFIDGQPSQLSLDQIPSFEIDRIEVITNPSAKYTANATGGIINVILKKNLKPGYYGQVNTSLGTNNRRNLGGNLNQREKGFSIQASGNYSNNRNNNNGSSQRQYFSNSIPMGELALTNVNITDKWSVNGRIASDIQLSIRSTLRLSYSYNQSEILGNDAQEFEFTDMLGSSLESGIQKNIQQNAWKVHHGSINYRKTFPKEGKELNSDITFISSKNENSFNFRQESLDFNELLNAQNNLGNRTAHYVVWQIDNTNPINDKSRLEWGTRLAYKQSFSDFNVAYFDTLSQLYLSNNQLSNNYRIDDFVGAAYINYFKSIGKFGYQVGLRYEHTYFVANSILTKEKFSFIYPLNIQDIDKALFPAIYFSYKLTEKSELQLNFSRKIGRPEFTQLIPFITYADRQSIQIGNPVLGPEFINIEEFNYSYAGNKTSLLSGIYFRQSNGAITNILFPLATDSSILVSSFGNGLSKLDLGWENSIKREIGNYINITINAHTFYSKVSIAESKNTFINRGLSYNIKSILNVNLTSKIRVQFSGSYESPRIIAQGKINAIYYSDISFNYRVNKSIDFSATVSDIFNSKKFGTRFESPDLIQETIRRWETRYARINFTWKFGEANQSIFRRKSSWRREPGNNGTEMQEL